MLVTMEAMSEKKHRNRATEAMVANRKFMMSWVVPRSCTSVESCSTDQAKSEDTASCSHGNQRATPTCTDGNQS